MNLLEVIKAAKGKKFRRACWDDGKAIVFSLDLRLHTDTLTSFERYVTNTMDSFLEFELLANDWEVVPETMTWAEAYEKLKEGKKVRRLGWYNSNYHVYISSHGTIRYRDIDMSTTMRGEVHPFCTHDLDVTDWGEVNEQGDKQ